MLNPLKTKLHLKANYNIILKGDINMAYLMAGDGSIQLFDPSTNALILTSKTLTDESAHTCCDSSVFLYGYCRPSRPRS